jgi:hypothetical protein
MFGTSQAGIGMAGSTDETRKAMAATLNLIGAPIAVTLVYNDHRPSLERMQRDLRELHRRVDRALLGRNYHKLPAASRTSGWAVVEGIGTHPHLHVGWKLPSGGDAATLAEILNRVWRTRKFAPAGTTEISACDDGWAGYACKELTTSDHVFLF